MKRKTVDVDDFRFKKLDDPPNTYQIIYKDGTIETLAPLANDTNEISLTEITAESGYKLYFIYASTLSGWELEKITDDAQNELFYMERFYRRDESGFLEGNSTVHLYGKRDLPNTITLLSMSDLTTQRHTLGRAA